MVVMLHLSRPPRAINSGPNSAETMCYCSDICSETRTFLILLIYYLSSFKRLVMSFLSRPTSSSSASRSPHPLRPSSSSSSCSVSNSSMTEPLSVSANQLLHPMEDVAMGDNPGGAIDWSGSPEQVISPSKPDWVDPKVTRITSAFRTEKICRKFFG